MFAILRTGGKQYRVAEGDVIKIEKIDGQPGDNVLFDNILMVGSGPEIKIGNPLVEGASVAGELIETKKQKTIIIFKKKRRHGYRRRNGHRQILTTVRISEILLDGKKPSRKKSTTVKTKDAPAKQAAKQADSEFVDDIKLISGIGPALEKKLHSLGVKSLKDIAAFNKEDIERIDAELNFKGRIERDEWVEQAKELIDGKTPRAKIDQEAKTKASGAKSEAKDKGA